jgi:hypothetical protein
MSHPRATPRRRPEAALEADILLSVGNHPDVWLHPNPVGQGYYGCIHGILCDRQHGLLASHPRLRELVEQTLFRHRLTYGLGVGSPDLVGAGPGRCPHCGGVVRGMMRCLEDKSLTGRLREAQRIWHEAARARGIIVTTVRTVEQAAEGMGIDG